jgi:tRNA(fMet)-specific endonuclease VapC
LTYLLDTNTCIRYLNGRSASVRSHLESLAPEEVVLCSVVKAELYFGAARSRDPKRTLANIGRFASAFSSLPFDDMCAHAYGQIRFELNVTGHLLAPTT